MRFKNVRRLCGALAALLLLAALAGCGGSNGDSGSAAEADGEELIPVKIGSPATGDHGARMLEAARVAAENQYFEEELAAVGYYPEYVGFDGAGPAVNEAMISGDLDVAIYGDLPALVLASRFDGVTFIAMDNSAVQQGIVVQKDSGIETVEDLRSKRVIAETGTTCQKFLISLLESAGMTEDDVEQISATTANAQVEFAAGEADAVVLPCMAAYRLIDEQDCGTMLAVAGNNEALESQYVVSVRTEFLEENPEAGTAIVRALIRAQAFAAENPEEIYALFADSNYSADVYRSVYSFDTSFSYFDPEITPDCVDKLKSLNEYALEKGLITSSVDVDAIVDTSYYAAAAEGAE